MITQKDIDSAIRDDQPAPPVPVEPEPEVVGQCIFHNRREVPVVVREGSRIMFELQPGERIAVEFWSFAPSLSRFSEITYGPGNEVTTKDRSGWEPNLLEGAFRLDLLNLTNVDQVLRVDGERVVIAPGIPKTISVSGIDEPLIRFSQIAWKQEVKRVRDGHNPNYLREEVVTQTIKVERSGSDLKRLRQYLDDTALKIARRHQQKLPEA